MALKLNSKAVWMCVLAMVFAGTLRAQDIAGKWQGTISSPQGRPARMLLQVDHDDGNALKARIYSIDQSFVSDSVDSFIVHDATVKFTVGMLELSFEGKLASDGNTITGTWAQGTRTPFIFRRSTKATAWSLPRDPSSHKIQFVAVEPGVRLEVLDWGGTGRPVVFLAGLGDTAHAFDSFAPKFTAKYHVYGVTRRGFGESSYPALNNDNYSSDRLGDDVPAVMAHLHLNKPVLVGHSIAGEEMSSIGSRHPEKVSGLVYLDCGGAYAFYDRAHGDLQLDMIAARDKIEQLLPYGGDPSAGMEVTEALLASLPQLERELQDQVKLQRAIAPPQASSPLSPVARSAFSAVFAAEHEYTAIRVPCLAIFAVPHDLGPAFPGDSTRHAAEATADLERSTRLADAFEAGVPSARVVRLRNASHYVYRSNEAEVLDAMDEFLGRLSQHGG